MQVCLASTGFKVMIVDESHTLRTGNSSAKLIHNTETTVIAGKRASRLILLTGTPSLSRPYDLFRQVRKSSLSSIPMPEQ